MVWTMSESFFDEEVVDVKCFNCGSSNVRTEPKPYYTSEGIIYEYWDCDECYSTWDLAIPEKDYEEVLKKRREK